MTAPHIPQVPEHQLSRALFGLPGSPARAACRVCSSALSLGPGEDREHSIQGGWGGVLASNLLPQEGLRVLPGGTQPPPLP